MRRLLALFTALLVLGVNALTSQDITVELYYDGTWHNIVKDDDVYTAPIVLKRGQSDEATQLRPSAVTMQLANDDDRYRTSNPVSPLYGKAGRNTPTRVSVGGTVRGIVEASSWAVDQTQDFRQHPRRGKAWVNFGGGGLLQRIGQWSKRINSPFRRYNEALTTLTGYWPMEDARGTTQAFSTVTGAANTLLSGVSFDSQQRPPGSDALADVALHANPSVFQFVNGEPSSTNGWQYSIAVNMTTLGGNVYIPIKLTMQDGSSVQFYIDDFAKTTNLSAYDTTGVPRFSQTDAWPSTTYQWSGRWILLYVEGYYSAGTTTVVAGYRAADEATWHFPSGTYSGVTSSLDFAQIDGIPDGSTFGHVIGTTGISEDLTSTTRWDAFLGHPGEKAAVRFGRLIDEELGTGFYYVSNNWALSMPMGPQHSDSLPNLIKECVTTEDALLFDYRIELRLFFLCRVDRYNQTPAVNFSPADLPGLPVEVTDSLNVYNIVTASQHAGGDVTTEDTTSPLGTQTPPNGVGIFQQTVDVNLNDPNDKLLQEANWWMRRGTVNLPRFPQVAVNLGALDAVTVALVDGVDVGDVITISGMREYVIRLMVIGYVETIRPANGGNVRRTIVFTCVPDQQFQVGVWDSTSSLWDMKTATLNAAKATSDTTMTFTMSSNKVTWSQTSNYDIIMGGEVMGILGANVGAISGTGPYLQAITGIVRGKNGILKSHAAGETVHVYTPGRWAL